MAEAIAGVLVGLLATAAKEKVNEHVRLAVDAKDEVKKLQKTFESLQKVLNDAELRQFSDESVKNWVDRFKDVAYDMEDVLDEWRTEILRSQIEGAPDENDGKYKQMIQEKVSSYLCSPFSCFSKTALYYDIGSRIKDIRATLDSIQKDKDEFGFITSKTTASYGFDHSERPGTSSIIVDPIFGRDWDKEILLNRLMGDTSSTGSRSNQNEEEIEPYGPHNIISIIGMGGLGKTTLSQLLINDDKVTAHFESTMWVCVSEPFDRTRICQAIIHEATKIPTNTMEWNRLHHELIDSVKGKRFFLVLDDVWTEDEKYLNPLKDLLRHGAPGSRIMLTTRNKNVSEVMNSYQHNLEILSREDCWSLISRKANFVGAKNKENKALKDIGFEIARKCHGLPLYASIVGSLLRKKKTETEWRRVLGSKTWELEDVEQKLFKPLLLSYDDLQPPLKRCFAYCAIFPKDYRIKKHSLISMWMAQGFLNSPKGRNLDPKSIGEKYFDDLTERSFFQDFSNDKNGSIVHYKMHDIVHDFAQFLTKDEFYVKHITDKPFLNDSSKARHFALLVDYNNEVEWNSFDASILEAKHLRSLQLSTLYPWKEPLSNLLCHLRCLRVLKLKGAGITCIPIEIKELMHLRYLDLSRNEGLVELPDSLCSLYNLETLKLKECRELCKLPRGMGRMINLIHLDIRYTDVELSMAGGIGKFDKISTSYLKIIGSGDQESNMEEFKDLNLLQRFIDIRGLGRLKKQRLSRNNNINDGIMTISQSEGVKQNLDAQLVVELGEGFGGVLIQPDPNLTKLQISNYRGLKLGNWMMSLTYLRILELRELDNCTELPPLGLLPSLEELALLCLSNLKRIGFEIYGNIGVDKSCRDVVFPKLKELYILAENLEEWDIGDVQVATEIMPHVTIIQINSKRLKALPAVWKLSSLESLSITGSTEMTHIGPKFYFGNIGGDKSCRDVVFPKLEDIWIHALNLEEWDIGDGEVATEIMPHVTSIRITSEKLKVLPAVWKLPSLETLEISQSTEITHIGPEFYGIFDSTVVGGGVGSVNRIAFPKLKSLTMDCMEELEEFDLGVDLEERGSNNQEDHQQIIIMPRLKEICIAYCQKLKTVRSLSKLQSLEVLKLESLDNLEEFNAPVLAEHSIMINMSSVLSLYIWKCPKLKSLRELLHLPKLRRLNISNYSMLSDQLPTSLPNLKSLTIDFVTRSLLPPKGLAGFEKLQHLSFENCPSMKYIPEEVRDLTALQTLFIDDCCEWPPEGTNKDFSEQDEEVRNCNHMSHIPQIIITRRGKYYKRRPKYEIIRNLTPEGTSQHS